MLLLLELDSKVMNVHYKIIGRFDNLSTLFDGIYEILPRFSITIFVVPLLFKNIIVFPRVCVLVMGFENFVVNFDDFCNQVFVIFFVYSSRGYSLP